MKNIHLSIDNGERIKKMRMVDDQPIILSVFRNDHIALSFVVYVTEGGKLMYKVSKHKGEKR